MAETVWTQFVERSRVHNIHQNQDAYLIML